MPPGPTPEQRAKRNMGHPAEEEGIGLDDVLDRVTMQVFGRRVAFGNILHAPDAGGLVDPGHRGMASRPGTEYFCWAPVGVPDCRGPEPR